MKYLISIFLALTFLSSCGPKLYIVPLTPEGAKVILLGHELPGLIPGRPLDKCQVLTLMSIENDDPWKHYRIDSFDNFLKNKTAEQHGNVAIWTTRDVVAASDGMTAYSIQGMSLYCPDEALKAAGLSQNSEYIIKGREASYEELYDRQPSVWRAKPNQIGN